MFSSLVYRTASSIPVAYRTRIRGLGSLLTDQSRALRRNTGLSGRAPSACRSFHYSPSVNNNNSRENLSSTRAASHMIAFRYHPGDPKPIRETVPIPVPRPDEVIIKVLASGVCHSDIGILDGVITDAWHHPFAMGHEGAGVITELGSEVGKLHPELKKDTYVAVLGTNPCLKSTCPVCSSGRDNLCHNTDGWHGIGRDGFWAQYCAVKASCAIPIPGTPKSIPPEVAAVCTDAVLTPYHALKTCIGAKSSDTIFIIGCGGLGRNAIEIARSVLGTGPIIGCDVREDNLERAKKAGADYVVTPDKLSTFLAAQKLTIDVVLDIVGTQRSFDTALSVIKPAGLIHIIGLMAPSVNVPLLRLVTSDLTIKTSIWGCKAELVEVLDAVAAGKIWPSVATRPLEECLEVLDDFKGGKVKERVALIP